ncbi:energy-coupling factor transporter transmembrane component T family protein [Arthrobacter sp. TMN-37]
MRGHGQLLGLYVPGRSLLHRTPLALKALLSLGVSTAVVLYREPLPTAAGLVLFLLLMTAGARLPLRKVLGALVPALPVLALLGLYAWFSRGPEAAFVVPGGIAVCILAARLLTVTTPGQELLDGLVRLVRPLRRLGADPERFALTLSIMVRSIPYLVGSLADLRDAAKARGLHRSPRAVVIPVVVNAVAYAHATGQALAARGLGEHDDGEDGPDGRGGRDADGRGLSRP